VGYDRFEGEYAYRQLVELYRALRLYVNFFQPALKLKEKRQTGKAVQRLYLPAQTPFARLCAASVLSEDVRARMEAIFAALDPMRLLEQIGQLQAALWSQAVVPNEGPTSQSQPPAVRFVAEVGGVGGDPPAAASAPPLLRHQKRTAQRPKALPRWWRTRPDPFATVWAELEQWLEAAPTRTVKSLFEALQQRYPDHYAPIQLRTLQRRIAKWRTTMITTFDDHWLHDEVLAPANVPRPLGVARTAAPDGEERCAGSGPRGGACATRAAARAAATACGEGCWVPFRRKWREK